MKTREELMAAYSAIQDGTMYRECGGAGGRLRAAMGAFTENFTRDLITLAWDKAGEPGAPKFIKTKPTVRIDTSGSYFLRLPSAVQKHIKNNIDKCVYRLQVDVQVEYEDRVILGVECKAYSENAMLKRIMVDASIFGKSNPGAGSCLFQLESQLGGDYSNGSFLGSCPSHAIMSLFPDTQLDIITLLPGERKIDRPITSNPKPLDADRLEGAIDGFKTALTRVLSQDPKPATNHA